MKKKTIALFMSFLMLGGLAACAPSAGTSSSAPAAANSSAERKESTTASAPAAANSSRPESPAKAYDEPEEIMDGCAAEEYGEADCIYIPESECGYWEEPVYNTEEYAAIRENIFKYVVSSPLSTFAADVDTASYANLRRMLNAGYTIGEIPDGAVRAEEMINYFSYDYDGPEKGEPFGVNVEISACPWNPDNLLLMLGLQTEAIDYSEAPDSNLVFLIDVSGSMSDDDKLPLLKEAFAILVEQLGENDRVSVVTYSGYTDIVLEGVSGDQQGKIMRAIDSLYADGCTDGGDAIIQAYRIARENFIEGGNNRVIMATDGDLNVGITSESDLHDLITEQKESGVFLSVLGFGTGNYSDTRLETLADDGNGNYSYIDSLREAEKVFGKELGATLFTVAKDVKFQIEFNPAYVAQYRQIGYENRSMQNEEFHDDTKDGGEIGAGHSVTVLYELVPADSEGAADGTDNCALKYQSPDLSSVGKNSGEWMTLSVRYKEPDGEESRLLSYPIDGRSCTENPSDDFRFAAAVAEFAMVLTDSEFLADGSLRHIKHTLDEITLNDDYKEEFADLVYLLR